MREWGLAEFRGFYRELHEDERTLHRWQERLAAEVLDDREWPKAIDIPTGLGKTFTVLLAVFATAAFEEAPTRTVYVVDRRTVVDAAYQEALNLQRKLRESLGPAGQDNSMVRKIAIRLRERAGVFGEVTSAGGVKSANGVPMGEVLHVSRLHGGAPKDRDWRRSPVTPTVLLGTVDQIGSRILHRGYGTSERSRSLEAGLLGMDALLLLDEPHLSVPFLQTLESVERYQHGSGLWSGNDRRLETVVLGATLPQPVAAASADAQDGIDGWKSVFRLELDDFKDDRVNTILNVRKELRIIKPRRGVYAAEVHTAVSAGLTRLAVMVNTVSAAREVYRELTSSSEQQRLWDVELLVGQSRSLDRAGIEQRVLDNCGSEARGTELKRPLVVVSTQTLEAGADVSFEFIMTEAAPWPNLVQRAGRLLRWAERGSGEFVVLDSKAAHPAYGAAAVETTTALRRWQANSPSAHLGYKGIKEAAELKVIGPECYPPVIDAPVLLWEHLSTWLLTCPSPVLDIPVGPFLRGSSDAVDDVRLIWRRGIPSEGLAVENAVQEHMAALPSRDGEELEVPLGAAMAFLRRREPSPNDSSHLLSGKGGPRRYWVQDGAAWRWQSPNVRPGSRIVVDVSEGGLLHSRDGGASAGGGLAWDPTSTASVQDLGDGVGNDLVSRFRLTTLVEWGKSENWPQIDELDILKEAVSSEFAAQLFDPDEEVQALREKELLDLALEVVRGADNELLPVAWAVDSATLARVQGAGRDAFDWVLALGVAKEPGDVHAGAVKEQGLEEHSLQVMKMVEACSGGLNREVQSALRVAAAWHDHGKASREWQWSVGNFEEGKVLAKSGRPVTGPRRAGLGGLLSVEVGRHEALSASRLSRENGESLAVHLVGTHHGEGRPFFQKTVAGAENHAPSSDQAGRFHGLVKQHGPWGVSYLEAVLRLSDWAASANPGHKVFRQLEGDDHLDLAAAWPAAVIDASGELPEAFVPTKAETELRGLHASNLADFCTAVGLLRSLNRTDPGATLRWVDSVPLIAYDGGAGQGLLWDAMTGLTEFYAEVSGKLGDAITAGKSGLPSSEFRRLIEPLRGLVADDVERWVSGCHLEWVRLTSRPDDVAGNVAAIWTRGRSDPLSHIGKAADDFALVREPQRRRSVPLRRCFDEVRDAMVSSQGALHLLRVESAKLFGMDYRSASYRAKADRDAGYIPFLVGMAHYGFNAVFRPRGRRAAVGFVTRNGVQMADIWLNAQPLTFETLMDVYRVVDSKRWLGPSGGHLCSTVQKVSDDGGYYRAAEPVGRG